MTTADLYPDEQTEEQWRVVWFPPDKPDQFFVGTEAQVRRRMATESVAEWNPIIEKRVIVVHPWEGAE